VNDQRADFEGVSLIDDLNELLTVTQTSYTSGFGDDLCREEVGVFGR
jgi:hypothetical protein